MTAEAANHLTAAWAARLPTGQGTVLSGAGVYPLLALLAEAAEGAAADELRAVAPTALALPDDVKAAIGVWAREDVRLRPRWQELVAGTLTDDRAPLDAWSSDKTGGLVPAMPILIEEDTRLVLAGAVAVETEWVEPFEEAEAHFRTGPWPGVWQWLYRQAATADGLAVLRTPVGAITAATVRGRDDVDVTLLLGEEGRGAAELLPAAINMMPLPDEVGSGAAAVDVTLLPDEVRHGPGAVDVTPLPDEIGHGPGAVDVEMTGAFVPEGPGISVVPHEFPGYTVALPRFTVRAEHDLLDAAEVFGLLAATDATAGHFPGIAEEPLAVSAAGQGAVASFTARGFRAAASTYLGEVAGGIPELRHEMVYVEFDRPFGFLATHRPTGLVLFAGWVQDPEPYAEG